MAGLIGSDVSCFKYRNVARMTDTLVAAMRENFCMGLPASARMPSTGELVVFNHIKDDTPQTRICCFKLNQNH